MRKPTFCICENKDADQLRGIREADQRLCFRYIDSTIPLLPKYYINTNYHPLPQIKSHAVGTNLNPLHVGNSNPMKFQVCGRFAQT